MAGQIPSFTGELQAPIWVEIRNLLSKWLRIIAGDPAQVERAVFIINNQTVGDTSPTVIEQAQDRSQTFSSLQLQFTAASGIGFYTLVGGAAPTAAGTVGLQIPTGGGEFWVRGAENIRNLKLIAATGTTMTFSAQLYQAGAFIGSEQR